MNIRYSMLALAFATTSLLTLGAAAHDDKNKSHDMSSMPAGAMKGHSQGSMQLHQIMADGMKMPMTMSGNVDKDFATMMTMHHQQAIKMVDVLLKHGTHADLKAIARKMKAAQQAEIKQLAPHTR